MMNAVRLPAAVELALFIGRMHINKTVRAQHAGEENVVRKKV
jgi:hypothetical protein